MRGTEKNFIFDEVALRQIADEHNLSYEVCRLLIKYNRTGVREGDEQSIV